jgi:HlyD family secretion protein
MAKHTINWKLPAAGIGIALILGFALWPQPADVDIAQVSRQDVRVSIDEDGMARVRRRFLVSAPLAGRLQRITLEPGDRVARGRVVARLIPPAPVLLDARARTELTAAAAAADAALERARAERQRAGAALERARSLVQRQRDLAKAGILPADRLEADESASRVAEEEKRAADFAVEQVEHEVQVARARLETPAAAGGAIEVFAPIDGVVLRRHRESESDVHAGDPLLEIGDPSQLEIVADVLSADAVRIATGSDVIIEGWGGPPLAGLVRRVEPSGFMKVSALGVEEQRVNVIVDFREPGDVPKELGDGYRVDVSITLSEAKNVLTVPVGSLFRDGENWAVMTIVEGRAHLQTVTVGQRNDSAAEILGGLQEADTVILHPPDTVREGVRVRPRTET